MRKYAVPLLLSTAFFGLLLFLPSVESKRAEAGRLNLESLRPLTGRAVASGISGPVSAIKPVDASANSRVQPRVEIRESPNIIRDLLSVSHTDSETAPAIFSETPMPPPSLAFDGLTNFDNISLFNLVIIPPDTIGDVGPNHYVQAANTAVRIFDKTGAPLTPAFKMSDVFAPLGTLCSTRNDGEPVVVYDSLADRWLISQYCNAFPPFRQMIAISKTGDPTGQYYLYEFVMPNNKLNDVAKFGVWPDAFYMSTDEFLGSDYVGSGMFAFDRAKMLSGDPTAGYIYFNLPVQVLSRIGGVLPADLDGLTAPPRGAPGIFAGYSATEYGDAADILRLFDFRVDFAIPANSTFTERPDSPLAVTAFDPTSPSGRSDISQPPPGERLDAVSDRLMYRVAYRNFGDHDSLVFNQTVRTSPADQAYRAGVRVYELRRPAGGSFAVREQSTLGDPSSSRWIGSAAQDGQGNLAVGFNMVTDTKEPSIMYSGKLASDPAGVFRMETPLVAGTGVQKAFGWRWGEYSGLSVDPADDCTFWITGEYYTQESEDFSDFTWLSRIGRFKFPECTPAPRGRLIVSLVNDRTNQLIGNGLVEAYRNNDINTVPYVRYTASNGPTETMLIPPGAYTVAGKVRGYRNGSVSVNVPSDPNGPASVSLRLEPIPIVENTASEVTSESCGINHAAEPGETVTLNVSLRNTGTLSAQNLTVTLLRSGGVINPGPPQNFGSLPPNGSAVSRPFTFTVSPNIRCGQAISMTFRLDDGVEPLGTLTVPLQTGVLRYALTENFDTVSTPSLPAGWTSSSTGAQLAWVTSGARSQTAPNSAFSPDPNQVGLNELVSPTFSVASPTARLTFRNWYELETTFLRNKLYDGSVLEIKIGGGDWQDILAAGGAFESGGYDGILDSCCQNPLAGRMAWSGRSGPNQASEFITSTARLPASAAGRSVQLRWRVGTDIGTFREGQYVDNVAVADGYTCTCTNAQPGAAPFDFDGDGKTDLSVFRPTDIPSASDFFVEKSSDGSLLSASWGSVGDRPANADYDGDGKIDFAIFRPVEGAWYILRSSDSNLQTAYFGVADDKLTPSDFDGDNKAEIAVYRASTGVWYGLNSSNGQFFARQFGVSGDLPVPADYDGDGKADIAVFRPSTGVWYVARSVDGGYSFIQFGFSGDVPAVGDYDGDGRADEIVYRPSDGVWYLLRSDLGFTATRFGAAGDRPLQADFDGDGMADIAVYRPSTAVWYYIRSSDGAAVTRAYGNAGDIAVPSIFTSN